MEYAYIFKLWLFGEYLSCVFDIVYNVGKLVMSCFYKLPAAISWNVPLIPPVPDDLFTKLPLYGPLNIQNHIQFLDNRKQVFNDSYSVKFPNIVTLDEFRFLNLIAKGAFGEVLLAKEKKNKSLLAVKVISKAFIIKNNCVKNVQNEKRILQSIDSPFCVRLEYFCQSTLHLYLFMPFISGGDVFTHLRTFGRFKENVSKFYAAQVILAFELMHCCDVVFRDLKPENMILDHLGFLKIADFGFAKVITTRTYTFCGTAEYIAPEVITGHGYGKPVDWWSLGVLLIEMNSGVAPFSSKEDLETFKMILKVQYNMPEYFSPELKDLVRRLLQRDISKRVGALRQGVEEIKSHNWFKEVNWLELLNRKVVPPFIPGPSTVLNKMNLPSPQYSNTSITDTIEFDKYFEDF